MKYSGFGKTDVGMKRELNEDNFTVLQEEGVFVVADGMGGHNAGEVASEIAIKTITEFFKASSLDEDMTWPYKLDPALSLDANKLMVGIKFANRKIFRSAAANTSYAGMGTTVVSILTRDGESDIYVAHVGDSRCYCFFNGEISQVTEDHSLLNEYIKAGQITKEQAKNFPHKNVIMRALGMKDNVLVEIQKRAVKPGEIYVLCSDGLSDMVSDKNMAEIFSRGLTLEETAGILIDTANANGGKDNITVILVKVDNI
ncbi:MAG TPA: Stp1/IreP family PP2C-type Ser/Thr phosphatase [bacterium]|nr:Stp1/IreP family PP2C-type Ser/Thr phosphatase [bacterium]HPS31041.1 Stp1/IreP family PP2C-type Ser/Thr phosphatase [bacterium]